MQQNSMIIVQCITSSKTTAYVTSDDTSTSKKRYFQYCMVFSVASRLMVTLQNLCSC